MSCKKQRKNKVIFEKFYATLGYSLNFKRRIHIDKFIWQLQGQYWDDLLPPWLYNLQDQTQTLHGQVQNISFPIFFIVLSSILQKPFLAIMGFPHKIGSIFLCVLIKFYSKTHNTPFGGFYLYVLQLFYY